jgi:hypothetical protein
MKDTAMLVRGIDAYGHFEPERRPSADFDPEAVAYHAAVQARLNAITDLGARPDYPQQYAGEGGGPSDRR